MSSLDRNRWRQHPKLIGGLLATAATISLSFGMAGVAQAATFAVTTTADTSTGSCEPNSCSLRQALGAAANGDTVVLPASASAYQVVNGPLVVSVAVTIAGAGAGSTTISGAGGSTRVANVFAEGAVTIKDLTITGGNATNKGGGIAAAGPGPLILDGVTVTANTVSATASGFNLGGGGIWSSASLTLIDSTVSANTATVSASEGDGGGGGILMAQKNDNGDDLSVRDSTITGNSVDVSEDSTLGDDLSDANGGAGIYQDGGDLTVTGSQIANNVATVTGSTATGGTDGGGGIFMFGNTFRLEDSTVADNTADAPQGDKDGGGGILDSGNQSAYVNNTITANTTDAPSNGDEYSGGGGILLNAVQDGVVIANSTINANTAPDASGGGINSALTEATEVTDSIVAGNSDSATTGNCAGSIDSFGYNLTDDPSSNDTCSFTASGDILGASPRLGALTGNGGPAPTEALQTGSPAISAGNPSGCGDLLGDILTSDERGALRPTTGACDIGAYQVALPVAHTGTAFVTASGAVVSGTAADPDPRAATVSFQYGATSSYGMTTTVQALAGGAAATTFTATLSSLSPGTYHFRIVSNGPDGASNGTDGVFTVAAPALALMRPAVALHKPVDITTHAATLLGAVNSSSQATSYHFVWGRRGHRLTFKTRSRSLPASNAGRPVLARIAKLRAATWYAVQLVATNAKGKKTAGELFFKTARRQRRD
jgi:CSLREA domain-containing protein